MDATLENLLYSVLAQAPFVAGMYLLYKYERAEVAKAHDQQIRHLETTISKTEERHIAAYERMCKIYDRALDETNTALKSERARRYSKSGVDLGDHPTSPKIPGM